MKMETFLAERRSPFYSSIVGLGATMGRVGGDFISAKYYSGIADEHLNTRSNVGVQDLSTMGKMDIKGPDAEALVNHVIVNDAAAMKPGQVRYSTVCREDGGIMDDLTVFRLGAGAFHAGDRLGQPPENAALAAASCRRDARPMSPTSPRPSPSRPSRGRARANC